MKKIVIILLVSLLVLTGCAGKKTEATPEVGPEKQVMLTVSAASSLKDLLEEIQRLYQNVKPHVKITFNFGSSGSLQQQIEQGAPVDVYISASARHMEALVEKALIAPETKNILLKNRIVLIAPADNLHITGFDSLLGDGIQHIGLGEPESVPAGRYGKEVLTSLGLWDPLQERMVFAKDVRQVLSWVESGNADAGLVYLTDAKGSASVRIVATAPEETHSPIVYPLAVLRESKAFAEARDFSVFLSSEAAKQVFLQYGFIVPE